MPSDGKQRSQDYQLLGTWVYGTKKIKYHVKQTSDGQMSFEGPHAGSTVSGVLQPSGEWLVAELKNPSGVSVGKLRLRYVKEFGIACSNFKTAKVANAAWGKDIFANREDLALADGKAEEKPKPKKRFEFLEVDKEEELLLVGECNNWNIGEAKRKFRFSLLPDDYWEGRLHHLRVEVGLEDFAFQLVSARKGWDFRLYPPLNSKSDLTTNAADVTVRPAGEDGDKLAQGRNFHIRKKKGWSVCIVLWIKDATNMALLFTDTFDRKRRQWGECSDLSLLKDEEKMKPPPFPVEVEERKPEEYSLKDIEPLQLVGECCKWNDSMEGLGFTPLIPEVCDIKERSHGLIFRLQARRVDFQIVSRKLGFQWRLFPDTNGKQVQIGRHRRVEAVLGGENDGHNKNFVLSGSFLSTVQLIVNLESSWDSGAPRVSKVFLWFRSMEGELPQVGIAPKWIQYPPKNLCCLDEEFLAAATTEEDRQEVLERRRKLMHELRLSLIKEYADEKVQSELLALRKYYPYHGRQSVLALEFSEELGKKQALMDAAASAAPSAAEGEKLRLKVRMEGEDTELEVPPGTTVGQLRQHLAEADPTLRLEDLGLKAKGESTALADAVIVTAGLSELELCGKGSVAESGRAPGQAAELSPLEAYRQDLELRLSLTREKLRGFGRKGEEEGSAGVAAALREQLEKQAEAFELALGVAREAKSREGAEAEVKRKWASSDFEESVFGSADVQYNHAVQELEAVQAAQRRALKRHGITLGTETARRAAVAAGKTDFGDVDAAVGSTLIQKRLRHFAWPHPETMRKAAEALERERIFVGQPADWFHGLDLAHHADWTAVRPDLEKMWKTGQFRQKFGGVRSGLFSVLSDADLHSMGCRALLSAAVVLKDQLQLLLAAMGSAGERLRVEPRVMVAFHMQGDVLPSRIDGAGTARRLSLTLHYSMGHFRILDGGALRLWKVKERKEVEVPAAGGYCCAFFTQEWKQALDMVKLSTGRWALTACAEDVDVVKKEFEEEERIRKGLLTRPAEREEEVCEAILPVRDNFSKISEECAVCQFSGGDGITMCCPEGHRVCRECLQKEIRMQMQPTCPACVAEATEDRVFVSDQWDLFESETIEDIGCICPRALDFDVNIDPGARVVIAGQCRESGLNGKLGEAIWWDMEARAWDVRIFALDKVVKIGISCLNVAECCPAGGSLSRCPCWPAGRGLYPVSLGCRCCVKQGILEAGDAGGGNPAGWPYFHGMMHLPFDWNLTGMHGILFFLRHSFEHFFHFGGMRTVRAVGREEVYEGYYSSMHTFIHHHPVKDANRLIHRAERLKVLCRHTRDVRAARPLLFIRYMHTSEEVAQMDELYSLLRLYAGGQIRMVYVIMKQTGKDKEVLYRHARFPKVLIYLVGFIALTDFSPFRHACRFSVYDEAGMLQVRSILPKDLPIKPFRDPYSTLSDLCPDGDWLVDLKGKDHAFYPDCLAAQKQAKTRSILVDAILAGDGAGLLQILRAGQMRAGSKHDPNAWDDQGKRPLHHVAELHKKARAPTNTIVRMAGDLLLAHADPNCINFERVTAVQFARRSGASRELRALLDAAVLDEHLDRGALFDAMEMLEKLQCSRLARILDVGGLRAVGEAELLWRHPPPDSESYISELEDVLMGIERLPEQQRKKEMKRLLLEWHPDKNAHRLDLATTVFQFLQAQKDRVVKR